MKRLFLSIVTSFLFIYVSAQTDNIIRAEKLFGFVTMGMGDSVYECMNEKVRHALPKEMLGGLMRQLEPVYGRYIHHDPWATRISMGMTIYCSDMIFERGRLCFLTAFDSDGKANTLRFVPAQTKNTAADPVPAGVIDNPMTLESGGFKMPAIFSMPKDATNVPAVVLVHGSGPNDKDETIGLNKPFRDLAWNMAQQGVAVFRYDKRTKVYGSKYLTSGKEDNLDDEVVDDAVAAVRMVMSQPGINPKRVYIMGHSLGAMLAPRIAQRVKGLGGVIMMAAPARPLEDVALEQVIYLNSQGVPTAEDLSKIDAMKKQVDNVKKIGTPSFNSEIGLPLDLSMSYWSDLNHYNQLLTASKLSMPILILQGERDYQVKMTDFALWKRKLGSNRKVQYKSYPMLNHLFMEGSGPSTPAEYMTQHHIPGYVISDVIKFINHGK